MGDYQEALMTLRQLFLLLFLSVWVLADALFFWHGLTGWGITWLAILVVVGAIELGTKLLTGRTLSQRFVRLHHDHPWLAWTMALLMGLGMLLLLAHLLS